MAKNYIQPGKNMTVAAPSGGVSSGDPVLINELFGVALHDAEETEALELGTEGVWTLPKVSTEVWAVGTRLFYDSGAGLVTSVATDNVLIGCAAGVTVNPSATGPVRLNGAAVGVLVAS